MRIVWSAPASEDRDAIFDYIEADNPTAAIRVDDRIREQTFNLTKFPEIGRPGRAEGMRELVILRPPFVVAYRVVENTVIVLRILHGAQQWPERLE